MQTINFDCQFLSFFLNVERKYYPSIRKSHKNQMNEFTISLGQTNKTLY